MKKMLSSVWRYAVQVDKLLLLLCLLASCYGLALIYSATYSYQTAQYVSTQAAAICLGTAAYLLAAAVDIRPFARYYAVLFLLNLLLLGSLHFWGVGDGNRSWIRFGGFGIQPAELGKILFIVSFAGQLAHGRKNGMRLRDILGLLAHAGVVCLFVMAFSRDDGMTLAFLFIALFMAFAAGVRGLWFLAGGTAVAAALPLLWTFLFNNYQKARILAVFEPEKYPDTAYQAMQTSHAIASGGLTGRGFLKGTQTQYSLIPTKHTDSILAVAGEELGFAGCAAVLLLLALMIARCLAAAFRARDDASALTAAGIAGMLAFQTVLNVGMNIGVLPVVGLTLPFFSYGGTSMVTMYLAMGVAAGIRRVARMEKTDRDLGGSS